MSEISASPFKLPPEQEAIRAKCFHPSGTFVGFPIEDVETSIHEAQSSGNWSAYGSKFSTFGRSASTTTFLIWAGIRLQQRGGFAGHQEISIGAAA
jgi:hypothetical protein